jgi:hypothetical protein
VDTLKPRTGRRTRENSNLDVLFAESCIRFQVKEWPKYSIPSTSNRTGVQQGSGSSFVRGCRRLSVNQIPQRAIGPWVFGLAPWLMFHNNMRTESKYVFNRCNCCCSIHFWQMNMREPTAFCVRPNAPAINTWTTTHKLWHKLIVDILKHHFHFKVLDICNAIFFESIRRIRVVNKETGACSLGIWRFVEIVPVACKLSVPLSQCCKA